MQKIMDIDGFDESKYSENFSSPLSGAQSVLSNYDSWCSLRAVNSFSQLLDTPK